MSFFLFELGRVDAFGFDSDSVAYIGGDGLIVRWRRACEAVEGVVILGSVEGVVVEEARESIGAARD